MNLLATPDVPARPLGEVQPSELFLNRDLSMLEFNRRVLELAKDESIPLLERLPFLCISRSSLDEFFEMRGAARDAEAGAAPRLGALGLRPPVVGAPRLPRRSVPRHAAPGLLPPPGRAQRRCAGGRARGRGPGRRGRKRAVAAATGVGGSS